MNMERILKELGTHFLSITDHRFSYGPQGRMLLRNFEEHWFLHSVTMSRYNVFLSNGLVDTFSFVTQNSMDDMPFGSVVTRDSKNVWNRDLASSGYKISSHRIAKVSVINNGPGSKELFHKVQKERKVWWRKLAQYPSRFKLTEEKRLKNLNVVEIEAQFPFGNITVETVTHYMDTRKLLPQANNSKKDFANAQIIEHATSLDWGCLTLLCDVHSTKQLGEMRIHSKLAPYKVAFNMKESEDKIDDRTDDLNDFVLYLNNILRAKGIETLLTRSEMVNICLVPFIVLVDRLSLECGIVHVTNRSTSLSEAVHVTDLVNYITMRC